MKNIIKKVKGKKVLSFVLAAIMLATTFNIALPELKLDASAADIDLGGITQTRVVSNYETTYAEYAERFFGGAGKSEATDFVIPGLSSANDYTPQGMTYWKAKDWILISAYDASGNKKNSVIYALDGKTTDFVALFKVLNADGSVNLSHGGGIAASEHNFYYADTGSKISYVPLSEMDVAEGTVKEIKLKGSIDCSAEMNTAYTSYCCYDEGVLWTGNFYLKNDNYDYGQPANTSYNSMLFGYKLIGNSSDEEWAYLSGKYKNLLEVTTPSDSNKINDSTINWNAYKSGDYVDIMGSISAPTSEVPEFAHNFGSASLEAGKKYNMSFYSTNTNIEIFLFAPGGNHASIAQNVTPVKTADGLYYYNFDFTAGVKDKNMNSTWPETATTDGSYTGTYTVRFDQNNVTSAYDFAITDFMITEANHNYMKLKHTSGTATKTNANMTYNIATNADGSYNITGTATNTSGSTIELTGKYATLDLVEGETYTMSFIADNQLTDAYIFAPSGANGGSSTHMRLFAQRGTSLGDGKYYYETTFTAGKSLGSDGDYTWPAKQSTDGSFTGKYEIRFDQDDIQNNETRSFTISNIKLTKADTSRLGYRGNHAGVEGNPTYCIAFDNAIDKIQYAMVDNGRIYISRSWSRKEGSTHVRQLAVGEIDLNSYGTKPLTINGRTRYCQLVSPSANNYTTFGGGSGSTNMFYMGEALCVMEGYLYMFAESAAWNYNGKDSSSVCPEPIDVIWKIDQYAIMGEQRETDNEKLSHYELVTDRDKQITNTDNPLLNTDEYIIVYESSKKDPVTQKNILYALDAFGGNTGSKLPKNSNGDLGENTNGYTIGIVGHPITEYNIQDGKLYLTNPEKDDLENIRWKFSDVSTDEAFRFYELQSVDPYYSKYKELFFSGKKVFMSPEAKTVRLGVQPATDKQWYITIGKERFLWCNDGTRGFEDEINEFYKTDLNTSVFVEQAGTFHTDATTSDNVVGREIGVENYDLGQFYIYKRILDPNAEKESSKVYTNSTAELQSDGTYTINMETYAIAPTHYTLLDEQRPTDFIFVLDTSGSMSTQDCNGYHRHNSFDLEAASDTTEGGASSKTSNDVNSGTYGDYEPERMWIQHSDGVMCPVGVRAQGDGVDKNWIGAVTTRYQRIYLWYTHPNTGEKYWYHPNTNTWTTTQTTHDEALRINGNDQPARYGSNVFSGICYEKRSDASRLSNLQIAVNQLTYKIQNEAAETGLDHRIALVQYGSDSSGSWTNMGMYTNAGTSMVSYTGAGTVSEENYKKAFFNVNQFDTVRTIINNLSASGDTFVDFGFDMAQNIITNAKGVDGNTGYLADGNRSACIIMITDGCPGFGGDDSATANIVAEAAIDNAKLAKDAGAYVFTVQMGNNSMSGFDMGAYLDYTSSEYVDATGMSSPGERNYNEVNYRMDVDAGSAFNLDSFVSSMFTNVTANSRMALTQLDTGSILRQTLSDKFYAPVDGANVEFLFADGYYDGLGRLAFRNESDATSSGVTGTPTTATDSEGNEYYKYLDVKGFDYKNYYISKTHEGGKKLIIRITGVLPRTTSATDGSEISHINSAISDDSWTGIYQTETMLNNKQEFKGFPNESFTIPEYTYVLDYGLQMLDTDVNGTLCSVSDTLSKQSTYNTITDNGAVEIADNKLDLLYSLSPDKTEESGYTLIKRDDGTYDWFKINVVPASNVYYEETKMNDGASGKVAWSTEGSQDTENRVLPGVDDPYGWDNAYDKTSQHSNGTALYAKLNSSNKNTSTKTFKFTGTGIDIVSACGRSTGVIVVNIKDSNGKRVKGYIVDTYYENGAFNGSELVSQVPVVSWSGENYGTYTVDVAAMYLSSAGAVKETIPKSGLKNKLINTGIVMNSGKPVNNDSAAEMLKNAGLEEFIAEDMEFVWFDDNSVLNGGTGVEPTKKGSRAADPGTATLHNYIDGFRVYNPLGNNADTSGIYPETEKNAVYANVINNLAKLEDPDDPTDLTADGIAYVTTQPDGRLTFANYESVGPKNELYLNGGGSKSVSFAVKVSPNEKLMLGLRAVNGKTKFKVTSDNSAYSVENVEVNSATEMYYDITACLGTLSETKAVKITITNSGDNILALNHLKFSGIDTANSAIPSVRSVGRSGDANTDVVTNKFFPVTQEDLLEMQAILEKPGVPGIVKNGVVVPLVEEEEELPGGDNNEGELPGGDDNEGNVPENPDDGDSDVDDDSDSTESKFDIFSLIKSLFELIKKILFTTVGNEHLF